MPKFKTNRCAAKRFSVTGSGRIKYKKRGMRHGLEKHAKDTKRSRNRTGYIAAVDQDNVRLLIPYK